jgi:hypothetical protein
MTGGGCCTWPSEPDKTITADNEDTSGSDDDGGNGADGVHCQTCHGPHPPVPGWGPELLPAPARLAGPADVQLPARRDDGDGGRTSRATRVHGGSRRNDVTGSGLWKPGNSRHGLIRSLTIAGVVATRVVKGRRAAAQLTTDSGRVPDDSAADLVRRQVGIVPVFVQAGSAPHPALPGGLQMA